MRYLRIPEDIRLKNLQTKDDGQSISFHDYVYNIWLNDIRWESPKTNLARLSKILPEFDKKPGEIVELEDQDWTILKGIVDSPHVANGAPALYVPLVQIQLAPFEEVLLKAPTHDIFRNGKETSHESVPKSASRPGD